MNTKSLQTLHEEYDKAKEDCQKYAKEDERIQVVFDELINTYALPPNYGLDNPDFRIKLQKLHMASAENFEKYMAARKAYEKAAEELVEAAQDVSDSAG